MSGFDYDKDANGVVTVTMDMEGAVNSMSAAFLPALRETVDRLEAEDGLTGVVLASGKKTFFAGGDLNSLCQVTPDNAEMFFDEVQASKAEFRRMLLEAQDGRRFDTSHALPDTYYSWKHLQVDIFDIWFALVVVCQIIYIQTICRCKSKSTEH